MAVVGVTLAVLAVGLGLWNFWRGGSDFPPRVEALPDPDLSGMTAPVARAIRNARREAVARPDSAAAVGRFGQVCHAHWLHDEAAACYEIARALDPGEFRWVYLLAGVEELRGADGGRIDELFRESIRLAPDYPAAYVRRADALLRGGRWREARDSYAEAARRDPELVLAHRGLGQAALLLGDGATAVESLERAAQLAPDDRIAQVALARAYALVDRSEEAAEAAKKAETLSGEARLPDQVFFEIQNLAVDPESLRARVARLLQAGDHDRAIEVLTLLEESEGAGVREQMGAVLKQRANQLAFGGDFAAALAQFERAASLTPSDPEIEHNWGTVLLRQGKLEEAGRHFEKAIRLNPGSPESLYNMGVVLEGLGRTDEAIERFQAAAAINPRHIAARRLAELGVGPRP